VARKVPDVVRKSDVAFVACRDDCIYLCSTLGGIGGLAACQELFRITGTSSLSGGVWHRRDGDMFRLLLISLLIFASCGPCMQPPPQPARPSNVEGWKDVYDKSSGVRYRAVLLLKKGETSDNGKFGVRVVDILEAKPCCGDPGPDCYRRARVQFYNPASGLVLCETESPSLSNGVIPVQML